MKSDWGCPNPLTVLAGVLTEAGHQADWNYCSGFRAI